MEEWKTKGKLLQELDALCSRIAKLEQVEQKGVDGGLEKLGQIRIFDYFDEGVLLTDLENKRFVSGNKSVCQMLGYDVKDISSLEIMSICPPDFSSQLIEQFKRQTEEELVLRKDIPITKKDGNLLYVDIVSVPLTFSNKTYIISFLRKSLFWKIRSKLNKANSQLSQPLTETEVKVLKSIVQGMSNKEIAHLLHRSIRTIQNHRLHIMKKLRVNNSVELVKRAIVMGLFDLDEIPEHDQNKPENYLDG